MTRRIITFLLLLAAGIVALFLSSAQELAYLSRIATSLFVVATLFFIRILASIGVEPYIRSSKARYTFRKTASILLVVFSLIFILQIWIEDARTLLVAYGLVGAGVAVALQDIFKNFAGGITILTTGIYHVGNRIEIDGRVGDVIDIGMFYTTLLEVRGWVEGDQATGRISIVPNGAVLGSTINNYTCDHHFLWDEIRIPITYDSNTAHAVNILTESAKEHTKAFSEEGRRSLTNMERRYYLSERTMEPSIYVEATDNWVMLSLRYVVEVRERRNIASDITESILKRLDEAQDVTVASETLDIIDFPQ